MRSCFRMALLGYPWLSKTTFPLPFCLPAAMFLGSSGSPRWDPLALQDGLLAPRRAFFLGSTAHLQIMTKAFKMISKLCPNITQISKQSNSQSIETNHPKVTPKSSQKHFQINPKSFPNHSKIIQSPCQIHSKIIAKSYKNHSQLSPKIIRKALVLLRYLEARALPFSLRKMHRDFVSKPPPKVTFSNFPISFSFRAMDMKTRIGVVLREIWDRLDVF